jgi:hypothetical protein
VNAVAGDGFSVLMMPHTLRVTAWGERCVGHDVNLEIDVNRPLGVTLDALKEHLPAAAPSSRTPIRDFIGARWNVFPSVRLAGPNPQSPQLV